MTLGQIYILAIDSKLLIHEQTGVVRLTPEQAVERGIIKDWDGRSRAQVVRDAVAKQASDAERQHRRDKRNRKREATKAARQLQQQQPEKH